LVALFFTTTPVQPWYAISALAIGSLAAWPAPAAVVAAGYPYYFAVILGSRNAGALGRLGYACAAVIVVAARPSRFGTEEPAAYEERTTAASGPSTRKLRLSSR
jgi:hypothetical protein